MCGPVLTNHMNKTTEDRYSKSKPHNCVGYLLSKEN